MNKLLGWLKGRLLHRVLVCECTHWPSKDTFVEPIDFPSHSLLFRSCCTWMLKEGANVDLSNVENLKSEDNSQRGVQYQCNPLPSLLWLIQIFASRELLRELKYDRHGVTLISLQRIKVTTMWFLKCKGKICLRLRQFLKGIMLLWVHAFMVKFFYAMFLKANPITKGFLHPGAKGIWATWGICA